ncbi:MAG: mevalonate kinase [Flavobacteriales bacterium AspAUS03]
MRRSLFPAKVLLFGEHGIMENSKGLSIPHSFYKGAFRFDADLDHAKGLYSNAELKKYYVFLVSLSREGNFPIQLHLDSIDGDIQNGMYFSSNIPQGYGVGSSGALVAAVYDRYTQDKITAEVDLNKKSILRLKKIFSQMESYFHGKSSGVDPLICYLNLPLLIRSSTDISTVGIPEEQQGKGAIFLINSGTPSSTASMVQIFFEKLKHAGFRKTLKEEFIKYNDDCIDAFLKGDFKPLLKNVKQLSVWAYRHFRPMIPVSLWEIWEDGIFTNDYYLKLCGSGGGGFVLGFTPDYEIVQEKLKAYEPEIVFRF